MTLHLAILGSYSLPSAGIRLDKRCEGVAILSRDLLSIVSHSHSLVLALSKEIVIYDSCRAYLSGAVSAVGTDKAWNDRRKHVVRGTL